MADTIIALATPGGRSGIGVIRLSGPDALEYTSRLCSTHGFELPPRHAALKTLFDLGSGEPIDEAVITWFKAPRSFTGEDVIEISCHGSPVLLRQVIDICLKFGARLAEPGEFTLRALANGRMNLAEAEAVRDLIDSQTAASARQAVRQLRGEFSSQLQPIKDELLDIIVVLESALEFVEDDLPETQTTRLRGQLESTAESIDTVAGTFKAGRLLREGLKVTLAGRPNVGKSSLFNALLGTDRAIVTEIAGTTRDQINENLAVEGIPVSLMDTAGLRETEDTVEIIGVERSRRAMADSDLVLVLIDASEGLTTGDRQTIESVLGLSYVVVINKTDKAATDVIEAMIKEIRDMPIDAATEIVPVSAKTGSGLEDLKRSIVRPFSSEENTDKGFLVTDARHHDLLTRAHEEILSSLTLLDQKASEELTLIGLHNALRYLGQITGETTPEDMLTRIFATFCIGK